MDEFSDEERAGYAVILILCTIAAGLLLALLVSGPH